MSLDEDLSHRLSAILGEHEIEILHLFDQGRISRQYVKPILVMLEDNQLGEKSKFKRELGAFAS